MAKTDIMIDLETLATSPDAAILTIGAVKFDPFGDDINEPNCEKFYVRVDLDSCDRIGLVTNDDTINAMNQLYKFCWGAKRVWSHGASFDVVICEHIFNKIQKAVPWKFWEVRCTRTLFDIGIDPERPPVLKHHALEDAWNQAVGVQHIFQKLRGSTMYNGKMIMPFAREGR